jgi:hypothetical protein
MDDITYLAGCALQGMLSNPQWMEVAKEESVVQGRGDVPSQFAKFAVRYAEKTVEEIRRSSHAERQVE